MRKLSPREYNFLKKHNLQDIEISQYGEMPVEYIANSAEFLGKDFYVNQNVLIPRIETEQIIGIALEKIKEINSLDLNILEIASGSGVIGLTIMHELIQNKTKFTLTMSDISIKALNVIIKNLQSELKNIKIYLIQKVWFYFSLKLTVTVNKNSIHISKSNLLNKFKKQKYDLIIANLPYIPTSRINDLDKSVKEYEPILALDGGKDGFYLIRKLLMQITECNVLNSGGSIILEVDDTHDESFFSQFNTYRIEIIKDEFGKNRFAVLQNIL